MKLHLRSFVTGGLTALLVSHFDELKLWSTEGSASGWLALMSHVQRAIVSLIHPTITSIGCAVTLAGVSLALAVWCPSSTRKLSLAPGTPHDFATSQKLVFPFVEDVPSDIRVLSFADHVTKVTGHSAPWSDDELCKTADSSVTRFTNVGSEPPHRTAIMSMFLAAIVADGRYEKIRDSLARAFVIDGRGRDVACQWAMSLLASGDEAGQETKRELDRVVVAHGWSETIAMALLVKAREARGIGCAEFGWLQRIDAPLFYALNSVGRPSHLAEGIGAACQFEAEIRAGKALNKPSMVSAVAGMRMVLEQMGN